MLGLYALGIIAAILMARLFSRFLMRGEDLPFVMELPPYRMPTATYDYDYTAREDGTLFSYDYNSEEDLVSAIKGTPAIAPVMASASIALLNGLIDALNELYEKGRGLVLDLKSDYTDYRNVCATLMLAPEQFPAVEALEPPEEPEILSSWHGKHENCACEAPRLVPSR